MERLRVGIRIRQEEILRVELEQGDGVVSPVRLRYAPLAEDGTGPVDR